MNTFHEATIKSCNNAPLAKFVRAGVSKIKKS